MALYVIGDTHFSSDGRYSMDVFGDAWKAYTEKLADSFSNLMPDDRLVICGDFSWAMDLEEALPDFEFLDRFKGRKILLKGNHDYWWDTVKKMKAFLSVHGIETIDFLHNNFFDFEDFLLCGTRGWVYDKSNADLQDIKMLKREVMRLEHSLTAARDHSENKELLVFLHYPPVYGDTQSDEIMSVLKKFGVRRCFYGHLHAESIRHAFEGARCGIDFKLVSSDALNFEPFLISK